MNSTQHFKKGFLKTIIIIFIALFIAAWFGFDIGDYINEGKLEEIVGEIWDFVVLVWEEYIIPIFEKILEIVS